MTGPEGGPEPNRTFAVRLAGFELSLRRAAPWPNPRTARWLGVILAFSAILGVRGLDWGLPFQWHPDEKVQVADTMIRRRTLEPPHFINPSLHVYTTYAAVRLAYAVYPRQSLKHTFPANLELTKRDHPDRGLQFLAHRLSRLSSVIFQLGTVFLLFRLGQRHVDETTGLLAAWFGAATMGLVNMAHFATGESLLFFLCTWALWRFSFVAERGWWRDYVLAGVATGLACSTKYTPWVLAVPFLAAHFSGRGFSTALNRDRIARMAVTFACTIGAFVATTPYAVITWGAFREALVLTWRTGAPSGSLAHVERSWIPYIPIIANALGWPLFALALAGMIHALWRLLTARRNDSAGNAAAPRVHWAWIHLTWILAFYGFYGITYHRALRFIMPIGPSLVLLAAVAGVALVRAPRRSVLRHAALLVTVSVGLYSTAYAARASWMFVDDTRYVAARWIQDLGVPSGMPVDYFSVESYLPYFDRPSFQVRFLPYVLDGEYVGNSFWAEVFPYLQSPASGIIVDADFFYPRYFHLDWQARLPDRIQLYRILFRGEESPYRLVARFTSHGPWWLDPRPELVCPEVVVFATRAIVPDPAVMKPMPPPRDDVRRLLLGETDR
jgi:Dolichyl-phosphate-mannose-protein mannosyltransferase